MHESFIRNTLIEALVEYASAGMNYNYKLINLIKAAGERLKIAYDYCVFTEHELNIFKAKIMDGNACDEEKLSMIFAVISSPSSLEECIKTLETIVSPIKTGSDFFKFFNLALIKVKAEHDKSVSIPVAALEIYTPKPINSTLVIELTEATNVLAYTGSVAVGAGAGVGAGSEDKDESVSYNPLLMQSDKAGAYAGTDVMKTAKITCKFKPAAFDRD